VVLQQTAPLAGKLVEFTTSFGAQFAAASVMPVVAHVRWSMTFADIEVLGVRAAWLLSWSGFDIRYRLAAVPQSECQIQMLH
jgi:hypothetical protein